MCSGKEDLTHEKIDDHPFFHVLSRHLSVRAGKKLKNMKNLMVISAATLANMLAKGNIWYAQNWEAWADQVYVVFFLGYHQRPIEKGRTVLVSVGRGNLTDYLLAPLRIFRMAKKVKASTAVTGDLVFSWWTTCLVRLLVRITLMPVCHPDDIYRFTRKSLSNFLPISLERVFTGLCFKSAHKVLTCMNFAGMFSFCRSVPGIRKKLVVVDILPDALPSTDFLRKLRELKGKVRRQNDSLLYVGRLHREKRVADLVEMMVYLKDTDAVLHIIGDGPERQRLEQLSRTLDVESSVRFLGMLRNKDLPEQYLSARLFVSPYTGTSFREALMCGTQVIAYDTAAIEDKSGIITVPFGDIEELANAVRKVLIDEG